MTQKDIDKNKVLNYISNLELENGVKPNEIFPHLYLNEDCNICRLGSNNKEYRYNTARHVIETTNLKQVCSPLTNTCEIDVEKIKNTESQYEISIKSSKNIYPSDIQEEKICSNKQVNPVENFTGMIVPSSKDSIVDISGRKVTGGPAMDELGGIRVEENNLNPLGDNESESYTETENLIQQIIESPSPDSSENNSGRNHKKQKHTNGSVPSMSPSQSENMGLSSIEGINKELLGIINQITRGYIDFSNRQVIQKKLDNLELMIKKLEAGGTTKEIEFLKKLLVASQIQMNNAINKLSNNPRNYLENPSLPGITQFKPSGTSNIFSPLIDIRTHDAQQEDKFSDAYEKGFKEGMKQYRGDVTNYNYVDEETKINQSITDSYKSADKGIIDIDDSILDSNIGDKSMIGISTNNLSGNNSPNVKNNNHKNTSTGNNTASNGYQRGNNSGKLGIPGYSYLEPKLFNVPQQRTPICHQVSEPTRGNSSLEPAGYLSSGNSNVMEFHGVGSILPKFNYKEHTESKKDSTNRY